MVLWWFLAVAILIFIVMSLILNHHWSYYGIKEHERVYARAVYYIIGIGLLMLMTFLVAGYMVS